MLLSLLAILALAATSVFGQKDGLDFFFWGDWGNDVPLNQSENGIAREVNKIFRRECGRGGREGHVRWVEA